ACRVVDAPKGRLAGLGKLHREATQAKVTSELLAKQHFNVWLIINHKNQELHAGAPALARVAALQGSTIRISVNSPGLVSTSIDPQCCLTMMSWLMERPGPVPSPAGFVVKKGLNIFSFTSGGMPVPLSPVRFHWVAACRPLRRVHDGALL